MSNYKLTAVGIGVKFLSHVSAESKSYIEKASRVLYLVNDPLAKEWIESLNNSSESLDKLYTQKEKRYDSYLSISNYIINTLEKYHNVCVVLYGHPSVFSEPALLAVKEAKTLGYEASILPAISSEDCLFADLMIDPGSCGCQSFEATDFIIRLKKFDTTCHVILWQIGVIGRLDHVKSENSSDGIQFMKQYLLNYYDPDHQVYLYEAAQYPGFEPRVDRVRISDVDSVQLRRITTLYIPPENEAPVDYRISRAIGLAEV